MAPPRATVLIVLFVVTLAPHAQHPNLLGDEAQPSWNPSNPTGVDLRVTDVAIAYTSTSDQSSYRMFSSNHPIVGFNRPANLYVIDGMVDVESTLTITVENTGTANSGVIDVTVTLLHNEYSFFEIVNTTVQMNGLSGTSSDTVQVTIEPGYAGNHSMIIVATPTVTDDDDINNVLNRHFTVGSAYFNCDTTTNWSFGSGWSLSSDTSISRGSSCHVGNGQSSTYANNMLTSMTTPMMDMSDAVKSALRTNGLSFYYTGSSAQNDVLRIYGTDAMGAWVQFATLSGTVDQSFFDGVNWQTFSQSDKGASSPLVPVPDALFHARSQFKFEFSSDATGTDLGFYLDEIVVMYDQKVRIGEFDVEAQGLATTGAIPGAWGSVTVQILNTGNITETFIPTVVGVPTNWSSYFSRPSGTSFNPESGLTVRPGEPASFDLRLMPDNNASTGYQQLSIEIVSQQYANVNTTLPVQFLVKADRIPSIIAPSVKPSCPPTLTCAFVIDINNLGDATDVFDLTLETSSLPEGWAVQYDWSQRESVLVRPLQPESVAFVMSVPETAAPDTVAQFGLTMTAQNDSTRTAMAMIDISASMISNASVELTIEGSSSLLTVEPGEAISLTYTITNHATRQDIFAMRVEVADLGQWSVEQPNRPPAVLNAGSSTSFIVTVTPPATAQAGDRGPTITPVIESERSQMVIEGTAFGGLRAASVHDVVLDGVNLPSRVNPGQFNELTFNITNRGNGPVTATLEADGLPEGWSYSLEPSEHVENNAVRLTPTYDLNDQTNVTVLLVVPGTEDAGSRATVEWRLTLIDELVDISPDDNTVEWTSLTAAVRAVSLTSGNASQTGTVGEPVYAEAIVANTGNALEDRLSVRATVSTSPPATGLLAFFTLEGGDREVGAEVPFTIGRDTSLTLRMDLLLPEDIDLNTRIVVRFEILGALDEEDLPVAMESEHLVIVEQRRSVDVSFLTVTVPNQTQTGPALVWVNLTSTSTVSETMVLTATSPDGWQVVCNQRLLNSTGESLSLAPGHQRAQLLQSVCEIMNLDETWEGEVTFTVRSTDGVIHMTESLQFAFKKPAEETGFKASTIAIGGGGFMIALAIGLLFMRGNRSPDDRYEVVDKATPMLLDEQIRGPPISVLSVADVEHNPEDIKGDRPQPSGEVSRTPAAAQGPPLPDDGLPDGWTMEQWVYYGQQYLDGTL